MPVCNRCESEFDVESAPGALMFGHPSTVKEAVPVWKAHLCQGCEAEIVMDWARPPIGFNAADCLFNSRPLTTEKGLDK